MTVKARELLQIAFELSASEREEIVAALIQSLDGPLPSASEQAEIDAAWTEEIKRRVAGYRNGTAKLIDADEVYASLRAGTRR